MLDHSLKAAFQHESCNPSQDCKHNESAQNICLSKLDILWMVLMLPLKVLKDI